MQIYNIQYFPQLAEHITASLKVNKFGSKSSGKLRKDNMDFFTNSEKIADGTPFEFLAKILIFF